MLLFPISYPPISYSPAEICTNMLDFSWGDPGVFPEFSGCLAIGFLKHPAEIIWITIPTAVGRLADGHIVFKHDCSPF